MGRPAAGGSGSLKVQPLLVVDAGLRRDLPFLRAVVEHCRGKGQQGGRLRRQISGRLLVISVGTFSLAGRQAGAAAAKAAAGGVCCMEQCHQIGCRCAPGQTPQGMDVKGVLSGRRIRGCRMGGAGGRAGCQVGCCLGMQPCKRCPATQRASCLATAHGRQRVAGTHRGGQPANSSRKAAGAGGQAGGQADQAVVREAVIIIADRLHLAVVLQRLQQRAGRGRQTHRQQHSNNTA